MDGYIVMHINPSMNIDISKIEDIEIDGVDTKDYPDFSDAFISAASYEGRDLTDEELDWVCDNNPDLVHEEVYKHLY